MHSLSSHQGVALGIEVRGIVPQHEARLPTQLEELIYAICHGNAGGRGIAFKIRQEAGHSPARAIVRSSEVRW